MIGLANYSADLTNFLKQANDRLAEGRPSDRGVVLDIDNVRAVGLKLCRGCTANAILLGFRNDDTRALAARFVQRHPLHIYVNEFTAGVYASVSHYLKAEAALGERARPRRGGEDEGDADGRQAVRQGQNPRGRRVIHPTTCSR